MVLKDVRPIIAELVRLKKSIPLYIDVGRYFPSVCKNTHGEAVRGGLKKALRAIEQAPAVDAVEVVRCGNCKYGKSIIWNDVYVECEQWKKRVPMSGFCYKGEKLDGGTKE